MPTYEVARPKYARWWRELQVDPARRPELQKVAQRLIANKVRYLRVSAQTRVPWWFIAVVHEREASGRFDRHLHNGDPLSRKTTRVPPGRPPGPGPWTWEESAIDALTMKGFHKAPSWPVEAVCYRLEAYNGFGYWSTAYPIPSDQLGVSPYLWASCLPGRPYRTGKFTRDHHYEAGVVDEQLGCMALLRVMADLDPSVVLRTEDQLAPQPTPAQKTATAGTAAAAGGAALLLSYFEAHWVLIAGAALLAAAVGAYFLLLHKKGS